MNGWTLAWDGFVPAQEGLREALCTLGNGRFATRGAGEESEADAVHYPGTYVAGGYDRLESEVAGRRIENEDLVNWPNWLGLTLRATGGAWLDLARVELLAYRQELDLRAGILRRRLRYRDHDGRETTLESRRLVHMDQPHLAAIELTITPENWSGELQLRSSLDGRVRNAGVDRYRALRGDHLQCLGTGQVGEDAVLLHVQTRQSQMQMVQAARTRLFAGDESLAAARQSHEAADHVRQSLAFSVEAGRPVRVEKTVAIHTSRDRAIADCMDAAERSIREAPEFAALVRTHTLAWGEAWHRCDVALDCADETQLVLRLHVFHLLQTVSVHTTDLDVGLPARGLHGEAYRGHVFWDEIFVFPFLTHSIPEITRALLRYRYRRLPEARRAARRAGYRGAMYPWQSGSNGREETQVVHLNPRSGRWLSDHTHLQRHINAAIAYNVWQYHQATDDREFLAFYGAEMVLEIARFWASLATYDADAARFDIRGVVGPDEYHDAYPDAEHPGLDNNTYTNVMAVWTLVRALDVLTLLPPDRADELRTRLSISDDELARWDEISRRMRLVFLPDGVLAQFEGWHRLRELDWDAYRARYGDIQRLDRILEAEGDTPNRYRASKQADVLMLFYLFSAEELTALFARLGYTLEPEVIPRTVEHYLARTSNGSTLSALVHAWVLARSDRARSWQLFGQALMSDVADIQGGTTAEGIHLGAMGGTVDLVHRCWLGLEMRDDVLWLNPHLPDALEGLRERIRYRGNWLRVAVRDGDVDVALEPASARTVRVGFAGQVHTLAPGETRRFRARTTQEPTTRTDS